MNSITRCKPLLGTYVELIITSEVESEDTLIDMSIAAYAEIEKIESLMSFHDLDSELSHLNNSAYINSCQVSSDTEQVLLKALELSKLTQGLYDISIAPELVKQGLLPNKGIETDELASWQDIHVCNGLVSFDKSMQLDLGGIAKGYAVDKGLSVFDSEINAIINAGGDLKMSSWEGESVYIKHPNLDITDVIELPMQEAAVATSACYYLDGRSGIISPDTNKPAHDTRSFSVFAPNCMLADALTKVAFLSGGNEDLIKSLGAELIVVDKEWVLATH